MRDNETPFEVCGGSMKRYLIVSVCGLLVSLFAFVTVPVASALPVGTCLSEEELTRVAQSSDSCYYMGCTYACWQPPPGAWCNEGCIPRCSDEVCGPTCIIAGCDFLT